MGWNFECIIGCEATLNNGQTAKFRALTVIHAKSVFCNHFFTKRKSLLIIRSGGYFDFVSPKHFFIRHQLTFRKIN